MASTTAGAWPGNDHFNRRQAVTVVAGAWVVLGVFVDGWAHFNRPGLETFFTPWHALLYSGAAALFGWLLLPTTTVTQRDRLWAVAAAAIFTAGGLGDLLWHLAFGVETGLSALALTAVVRWPAELVIGVLVLSTMVGAALALLAVARFEPSIEPVPAAPADLRT